MLYKHMLRPHHTMSLLEIAAMEGSLHVVMLPWLAFGHLIPFLQLSRSLAKHGVRISFISTSRNIDRLPKIPPHLAAHINFVKFPLPHVDDLPENGEATIDIPPEKIPYLKKAYDLLQYPFEQFLSEESPDWVICEAIPYWASHIATRLGVPSVRFSVFLASTLAFLGPPEVLTGKGCQEKRSSPETLMSSPDWIPFPSAVAFRHHEATDFYAGFYSENASGVSDAERIARVMEATQAVAVRSCRELEGKFLDLVGNLYGKPVLPVGLLPHPPTVEKDGMDEGSDWFKCFKWLDQRETKSVVFVGFGSECKLSRDQVFELAFGLEQSKLPFLWVLRRPLGATDDMDILPVGFADRTSDRGIVCMGWCPQLEVLAHPAIGGCLFHCGLGSVVECLQYGHTLVVLPLIIDQGLNARRLVEEELAVEVERNKDGSFTRNEVAKALRHGMVEEHGENVRLKAKRMEALIPEWENSGDYIGKFVRYLNGYKKSSSQCE